MSAAQLDPKRKDMVTLGKNDSSRQGVTHGLYDQASPCLASLD
jgi:hypothetical protein